MKFNAFFKANLCEADTTKSLYKSSKNKKTTIVSSFDIMNDNMVVECLQLDI